jgi:octaprenyl-diphosphate synthase
MRRAAALPRAAAAPRGPAAAAFETMLAPIAGELEAVSGRLLSQLADPVARTVVYLISAGGKRLRPALVLLAGAPGPAAQRPALIDAATAVELVHTATLIHDDIIDASPLRRQQPTFHFRWGTERAVLMGDYLYATGFTLLAGLERPDVMRVMAGVCQQLSRGELREVEARQRLDLTEEEYLGIIRDKTGSLIEGCCRVGALLGGQPAEIVERWATFGAEFGAAFQIVDDCLDLTGDQRELGKAVQVDLDRGAVSLPVIYLAQGLAPRARARFFGGPRRPGARTWTPSALARVARAAEASGAVARAMARARAHLRAAESALAGVPADGMRAVVDTLLHYAIERRS